MYTIPRAYFVQFHHTHLVDLHLGQIHGLDRVVFLVRRAALDRSHQHAEPQKIVELRQRNLSVAVGIENPHELEKDNPEYE